MDLFTAMRTFVEVAQAGSMNAAGLRLNVSGALVGQRIAGLEDYLQAKLLNRTTRQQKLTDFGASYLEQCRDILELVDFSEGKASDQQRQPQGRLRIAAPVSFGSAALMPALKGFTEIAPEVEIELTLSDNNEDLIAGGFDAAFRIGEMEDSALLQIQLAPYRMMICASGEYLAEHGEPQIPSDLNRFRAVLFSRTGRKPWRFKQGSEERSWTPQTRISVNSGQAVRVAAIAGMGVAMLPEILVRGDISAGKLVQLLPDWNLPEQPMALIYHRDRYRPQRLTKFIDFVKSVFRSQLV
ncbi:LysR family transcriptional regulator [Celeribacter baekdonensis]|jgi:DNA-binding transcriptional LysR family regulator|uniref:LysR family transcriptional regulator n=1 Tax=Celeribacter baekdonensis B30 TaxID=1208323 RepID=K2JG66_9RHOB|nr:LysR family transcriptional regulator [Celeribacter baekdonensis]EKE69624.1 LysR family transcriptional regulator [Celeribacter baekdonensis B30]